MNSELFALVGHTRPIWSVAFSPDGKHLASASEDGTVKVREAKAVQKALVLGGGAADVTQVAFSPDGKRLTSVDLRVGLNEVAEAKVWDTQTGEKLLAFEGGGAALSLDGRRLAASGRIPIVGPIQPPQARVRTGERSVWDLLTGEKLECRVVHVAKRPDYDALSQRINLIHAHSARMLQCARD